MLKAGKSVYYTGHYPTNYYTIYQDFRKLQQKYLFFPTGTKVCFTTGRCEITVVIAQAPEQALPNLFIFCGHIQIFADFTGNKAPGLIIIVLNSNIHMPFGIWIPESANCH
jgi:hypothetical protein